MHTAQLAPTASTLRPLETLARLWSRIAGSARDMAPALHDPKDADLPPHLRYDVGDLDCRPPQPATLDRVQRDRQTSVETMWLRYGV